MAYFFILRWTSSPLDFLFTQKSSHPLKINVVASILEIDSPFLEMGTIPAIIAQ